MDDIGPMITTLQVSAGDQGAGYVIISGPNGPIGYILSIDSALQTPDGTQWPVPGTATSDIEYWWFATEALQAIRSGSLTALSLETSQLKPQNAQSPPTLASDPLTAIPDQFGETAYVTWTTDQNPTFNPSGSPTSASAGFRVFSSDDDKVALAFKYSSAGGLKLDNLWWGTTETGDTTPLFWFGNQPGKPAEAIRVDSSFASVSQYPDSGSYLKRMMPLVPSSVPL